MSAPPRITPEQVRTLRAKRAGGSLLKELADEFGTSLNYISRICTGKDRKNVKAPP